LTNTHATEQTPGVPASGRYRVDPARSSVNFRTRHLFGLAPVTGTMAVIEGEISVDPASPHASVTATIDASSFDTGSRRRDRDVRLARFLHTEAYPTITFRADSLHHDQDRWSLTGDLTVHGVTQPATLAIESTEPVGNGFRARATIRLDRYAFGVTAAKGMAARYVDIDLTVAAEPR
jgi:polyisoprenoid-binding protein YceI